MNLDFDLNYQSVFQFDESQQLQPQLLQEESTTLHHSSYLDDTLLDINEDDEDDENDEECENYYQYFFISIVSPLFRKAYNLKTIGISDMPPLPSDMSSSLHREIITPVLNTLIQDQSKSFSSFRILRLIFSAYKYDFIIPGLLIFFRSILQFIGPIMIQRLVRAAQDNVGWNQI